MATAEEQKAEELAWWRRWGAHFSPAAAPPGFVHPDEAPEQEGGDDGTGLEERAPENRPDGVVHDGTGAVRQ